MWYIGQDAYLNFENGGNTAMRSEVVAYGIGLQLNNSRLDGTDLHLTDFIRILTFPFSVVCARSYVFATCLFMPPLAVNLIYYLQPSHIETLE